MSASAANVWEEFGVVVPDSRTEKGLPLCGLCGNSGTIKAQWVFDKTTHRVHAFCICPNGRSIRKGFSKTRWGGDSIRERTEE